VASQAALLLALWLASAGCGTVGEPRVPSAHISLAPTDLSAVERGDRIVVSFTAPALTTDAQVITSIGGADVRMGPAKKPFDANTWAETATRVIVKSADKPGTVEAASPPLAANLVGKDLMVGARVLNTRSRPSAWSNFVTIHVVAPVAAPTEVKATDVSEGIRLTWNDPGEHSFRIFRKGPGDSSPVEIGKADTPQYIDNTITWDRPYQYWVQALREGAESEAAESPPDTPKDIFPPAVPVGLNAVTGTNSIELAWERNTESDFRTYIIYRAVGDGALQKLAEVNVPTYSDKAVETGKRYRYAVSAIDQRDNESEKSPPVEAAAP
jgi:hypothetical protein